MASEVEEKFVNTVKEHLQGIKDKIENDFSKQNFESELKELQNDDVYSSFFLDSKEYVLIRLMGRLSVSIGRRLGEIYDKTPRFAAAARFGLEPSQVAEKFDGLEIDVAIRYALLSKQDMKKVKKVIKEYFGDINFKNGVGIEIRYNFNPNDSSRLRKDVRMGKLVEKSDMLPIYLIFSGISPRDDAISRLTREGWNFLVAEDAIKFTKDILGLDLTKALNNDKFKKEIKKESEQIKKLLHNSFALKKLLAN